MPRAYGIFIAVGSGQKQIGWIFLAAYGKIYYRNGGTLDDSIGEDHRRSGQLHGYGGDALDRRGQAAHPALPGEPIKIEGDLAGADSKAYSDRGRICAEIIAMNIAGISGTAIQIPASLSTN